MVIFVLTIMFLIMVVFIVFQVIIISGLKRDMNKRVNNIEVKISALQVPYEDLSNSLSSLQTILQELRNDSNRQKDNGYFNPSL